MRGHDSGAITGFYHYVLFRLLDIDVNVCLVCIYYVCIVSFIMYIAKCE